MKIEIDLTENDLEAFKEMLQKNETITWFFEEEEGRTIEVVFMSEDEKEQRDQ